MNGQDPTMWPTVTVLCVYGAVFAVEFSIAWAVRALARWHRRRRSDSQAAERVAAYVASLTPDEVAEILAIDHGKSGEAT